jgi:tetratricopeptide (TPR) repeat protein
MVTIKNPFAEPDNSGVRPSSGAETAGCSRRCGNSKTTFFPGLAAPEDGRTPGAFHFSTFLMVILCASSLLGFCGCKPPGARELWRGKKLIERGKYAEAISELKTATSILATNAQAWNYLGLANHYAGETAEAESAYRRALLLDHDLSETRYNLGCLLLDEKKPESARNELTAYILRRGDSPEVLLRLGTAQLRARDFSGAEKSFTQVWQSSATNSEALNGLGLVRFYQRRPSEAAQFFNTALRQNPGYAPAVLNLAVVAQTGQDRIAALKRYREYLKLAPASENAPAINAVIQQLEQGTATTATPASAQPNILSLRSTPVPANPTRQSINSKNPLPSSSSKSSGGEERTASRVTPLPPVFTNSDQAPAGQAEAEKLFAQGVQAQAGHRTAEAMTAYQSATRLNPAYFDAWYNLGVTATEAKSFPTALAAYDRALAIDPDSLDARYNLALALREVKKFSESARELEKLLARYPNEARANLALGNLYAQQLREPAKARPRYLKVLEIDPHDSQSDAIRHWIAEHPQ